MMKKISLTKKLLILCFIIGSIVPLLGTFTYFQAHKVTQISNKISNVKLGKTKELGELLSKFRDIRLQIRTVPVIGMSWDAIDLYVENTKKAVGLFNDAKKLYASKLENKQEESLYQNLDLATQEFLEFGGILIKLSSAHDQAKLEEVAKLVREVCPVKAEKVEQSLSALVQQQSTEAQTLVNDAQSANSETNFVIILGSLIGFVIALGLGTLVARSISRELEMLASELTNSSHEVSAVSEQVSHNGSTLSTSLAKQAAAIQETVSAIEEISSMVKQNSENAAQSKKLAGSSLQIADHGKKSVDDLASEVQEIQNSTTDLMKTVDLGNLEITKIVNVIKEIETKTKVINDIVFQTKLLSFNASVEAARAGEAGKGFAVVAEEVGNLAALSGKSAKEISDLLVSSVSMAETIVKSSQERIQEKASENKARVNHAIEIALLCGKSLNEVFESAEKLNIMVGEISNASHEQATGVAEVSKAMHEMDSLIQQNSTISNSSVLATTKLNTEVIQVKKIVEKLYHTLRGQSSHLTGVENLESPNVLSEDNEENRQMKRAS
ncbi:MAG: methyl-accepting chemotaxis protein [Bacteriovoracaceae bacterium]|nr:methyl-accepting chemotaxis protein [Bacteriovoracaceae bacterium]